MHAAIEALPPEAKEQVQQLVLAATAVISEADLRYDQRIYRVPVPLVDRLATMLAKISPADER